MSDPQQPQALTVGVIRQQNPFPWSTAVVGKGLLAMFDVNGKEVPLMSILALANLLTVHMAANADKEPT